MGPKISLGLKKAFNNVNHQILISKLSYFNFSSNMLKWIKCHLAGRVQCVRVSNETSPFLSNEMGFPQGSILGPLLFSSHINYINLPLACIMCEVQLYADDTVIYVHSKTKKSK